MLRLFWSLFVAAHLLAASGHGAVEEKIESAMGFRLGDVFVPDASVKAAGGAGDTIFYFVKAPKPFRTMLTCRVSTTPKSGRIVSIVATSKPFDTMEEAQREAMLVVALLKEKYLPKPEEIEQSSPAPKQPIIGNGKTATPAPPPKPTISIKVRRGPIDSPFPTDVTFKQGSRSILTELVSVIGTFDQASGKPIVQITYSDHDLLQMGAREYQELEKERARRWMEEQVPNTDVSGL